MASVATRGVIHAGLVIGAKIQVLVAHQSTPSLLASAFEGLFAGTVYAPRVSLALITVRPLPPILTLAPTGGLTRTMLTTVRRADGFRAISAFPSKQADSVAGGIAVVVAERIVPRAAKIRALLAIVKFIAHYAVREAQFILLFLGPVLANSESSFGGQTGDQVVYISC